MRKLEYPVIAVAKKLYELHIGLTARLRIKRLLCSHRCHKAVRILSQSGQKLRHHHILKGQALDVQGLAVILKKDLISGIQLGFSKDMVLYKQLLVLFRYEGRQGLRG